MHRIDNWDEYFMRMAYLVATRSKDERTKIGSVLVKNRIVIMTGYNSFPKGVKDLPERYNNRNIKLKMISHSEENTITMAASLGINTSGATCYTLTRPCAQCAKILIQGGIKDIVTHKQFPVFNHTPDWQFSMTLSELMLDEAGVEIREFDQKLGLNALLDGKIICV